MLGILFFSKLVLLINEPTLKRLCYIRVFHPNVNHSFKYTLNQSYDQQYLTFNTANIFQSIIVISFYSENKKLKINCFDDLSNGYQFKPLR